MDPILNKEDDKQINTKNTLNESYQIQIQIAIEKNGKIEDTKEWAVPTLYSNIKEAQFYIFMDIEYRLGNTMFFKSQKKGYDLVEYSREATVNTYLAYRIIAIK